MKRLLKKSTALVCIITILISMCSFVLADGSVKLTVSADTSDLKPGELVSTDISLSNIAAADNGVVAFDFEIKYDIDIFEFVSLVFSDKTIKLLSNYNDLGGRVKVLFMDDSLGSKKISQDILYAKAVFKVRDDLMKTNGVTKISLKKSAMVDGSDDNKAVQYTTNEIQLKLPEKVEIGDLPDNNQEKEQDTLPEDQIKESTKVKNITVNGFDMTPFFKDGTYFYVIKAPKDYNEFVVNVETENKETYVELKKNNDRICINAKDKNKLLSTYTIEIQRTGDITAEDIKNKIAQDKQAGKIPQNESGSVSLKNYNIKNGTAFQGGIKIGNAVSTDEINEAVGKDFAKTVNKDNNSGSKPNNTIIIILIVAAAFLLIAGIIILILFLKLKKKVNSNTAE